MRAPGRCAGSGAKTSKSGCSKDPSFPHQTRQPPHARPLIPFCSPPWFSNATEPSPFDNSPTHMDEGNLGLRIIISRPVPNRLPLLCFSHKDGPHLKLACSNIFHLPPSSGQAPYKRRGQLPPARSVPHRLAQPSYPPPALRFRRPSQIFP